jgi:hypothetical protein
MPMVDGINAGSLINAFRQGRSDRYSDEETRLKIAAMRQKASDAQQEHGLLGQLFGGQQPTGVAGAYAPTHPAQTPQAGPGMTPSFDKAFDAGTMGAIASGGDPAPLTPPAPVAPDSAAAQTTEPPRQPYDPNIMRKLIMINPEKYGQIATAFKAMDENELKQHQAKNDIMGAAAHFLSRYPPQQRGQMLQIVAPQLRQAGWSEQEIANANLSDDGLRGYQGVAIDFDKMIDNELAQRKFEAGKAVPVTGGGNVAIIKPEGVARWAVGGGAPAGTPSPTDVPHVSTPQEAAKLPPGSHFYDPNGVLRTVPGGASGNAGGGFPGAQ